MSGRLARYAACFLVVCSSLAVAGTASGEVLFNQEHGGSTWGLRSQHYSLEPERSSMVADDFSIPVGWKWQITSIYVPGFHNPEDPAVTNNAEQVNVHFFRESESDPDLPDDDPFLSLTQPVNASYYSLQARNLDVLLGSGRYWLGFQAEVDTAKGEQRWYWREATEGWGSSAVLRGSTCPSWTPVATCYQQLSGHQAFEILGYKATSKLGLRGDPQYNNRGVIRAEIGLPAPGRLTVGASGYKKQVINSDRLGKLVVKLQPKPRIVKRFKRPGLVRKMPKLKLRFSPSPK